ncbi:MAG TPA: 16S rRNA (uracil(1498)-N(3))-methyltransferase [Cyanobium sp.]|nr:16S rRNA (uracil(1498)-N(3))-methyltransferase [Cyanobium sp.]
MARELRRLLIPPARLAAAAAGVVALEAAEAHYLARVLRYRAGDRVAVIDGCGALWSASLETGERLRLEQPLDHPLLRSSLPLPSLRLALAVPKRDAELVWRMVTELGADRLLPLVAERRAVQGDLPLERWRTIVREAAEQCERLWLPELQPPVQAGPWLGRPPEGVGLMAVSRRPGLPSLARYLADLPIPLPGDEPMFSLAIGPEGGWSPHEEQLALEAGWQAVSLGEEILRTGTAAVAGVALLASWRELSCASFPSPSP